MFSKMNRQLGVICLLLATYGVAAVVGEGLHLLPGMGHAVLLPGGGAMYLGIDAPPAAPASDSDGRPAVGSPTPQLDFLASDECAVCSFCAAGGLHFHSAPRLADAGLVTDAVLLELLRLESESQYLFQARAPPIG